MFTKENVQQEAGNVQHEHDAQKHKVTCTIEFKDGSGHVTGTAFYEPSEATEKDEIARDYRERYDAAVEAATEDAINKANEKLAE